MAFTLGNLVVQLGLDQRGLLRGLRNVERELGRTGRRLQQIGQSLTLTVTTPLALATAAVVKFGAQFEAQMVKSLAIMNDVSTEMRSRMESVARDVSETTTFSAAQAAESYFFLASAGLDAAQSVAALPHVARFAQAGMFDMARATDLLTDAQSALGLTIRDDVQRNMKNMLRVSDALVKANTLANASVQQFSEALTNEAAAAMRSFGVSLEDGLAVLAAFADQGTKGADAGTKFKIVVRDLTRAAAQNADAFRQLNIEVYDAQGNLKPIVDIIADMEAALGDASAKQKRFLFDFLDLPEKSLAATLQLLGTARGMRYYAEELRKAGGTTERVSRFQLTSFAAQLKIIRDRLENIATDIYQSLRPALEDFRGLAESILERLRDWARAFGDLDPETRRTIIGLVALVAAVGPLIFLAGQLAFSLSSLAGLFGSLAKFAGPLLAIPLGKLIIVIAAVGAAVGALVLLVQGLIEYWEELRQTAEYVWLQIQRIVLGVVDRVNDALASLFGPEFLFSWRIGISDQLTKVQTDLSALQRANKETAKSFTDMAKDAKDAAIDVTEAYREANRFQAERVGVHGRPTLPGDAALIDRLKAPIDVGKPGPPDLGFETPDFDRIKREVEEVAKIRGTFIPLGNEFAEGFELATKYSEKLVASTERMDEIWSRYSTQVARATVIQKQFGEAQEAATMTHDAAREALISIYTEDLPATSEQITALNEALLTNQEQWYLWSTSIQALVQEVAVVIRETFDALAAGIGQAVAQAIVYQRDLGKAVVTILKQVAAQIIAELIAMAVQWVINTIIGKVQASALASAKVSSYAMIGTAAAAAHGAEAGGPAAPATAAAYAAAFLANFIADVTKAGAAGLSLGNIAKGAEGFTAFGPTLAMVAEAGQAEIVAPVDKFFAFVERNLQRQNTQSTGDVYMDGRLVGEIVLEHTPDILAGQGIRVT